MVQSLCEPQGDGFLKTNINGLNGHSAEIIDGGGLLWSKSEANFSFTHLLQARGETKNEEIVRGKTAWRRKKLSPTPFHS